MTLLNDFFYIIGSEMGEKGTTIYHIRLNSAHVIFGAHFPNNPITPGVCQIGMVEELVSKLVNKKVKMSGISNIKYISTLSPTEHETLDVQISSIKMQKDELVAQCILYCPDCLFTKITIKLQ